MSADTSTAATAPPSTPRPAAAVGWRRLATWDAAVVLVTVAWLLSASLGIENFGSGTNFGFLVLELAPVLVLALPLTLVIITGEIDLSVASTVALSGAAMGVMWESGLPLETIIPVTVVVGAVLGAVNGFFVTVLGLPSLAVTIGTLALYRGLAFVLLGDGAVADWPRAFTDWAIGDLPGTPVPNVVLPIALLVVGFAVVLHLTPLGRAVYATGANETAAAFSGIGTLRLKFWLFVTSGAVAGLVGVFWTLRFSSARGDNAQGLELTVVAAVLLGGVSIFGGRGALPGVVAGVVLLTSLQNALRLASVSAEALTVVTGFLLIVSVLLPNVIASARQRIGRRSAPPAPTPRPPARGPEEGS